MAKQDSDTVRAKAMYDKIDAQMAKFQKIVVDEDRIIT